jgi:hypothetical protein
MKLVKQAGLLLPAVALAGHSLLVSADNHDWSKNISINGLIEVEYSNGEDYAGASVSDVALATMALGIEARVNNMLTANVVLLEEDDDGTADEVDQAYLIYANAESPAILFRAGRLYIPFGVFGSHTVSDPLTLELGEAQESALELDYSTDMVTASFYLFNGDSNEANAGGDDEAEQFGVNFSYAKEANGANFQANFGYISSIADTDSLSGSIATVDGLDSYVAGINAYVGYSKAPFSLSFEHLGASSKFEVTELAYKGDGARPTTYSIDAGYELTVFNQEAVLGVSIQGSDEAVALGLPEERLAVALSMAVMEGTSLGFEWLHDKDYATSAGGSGKSADLITVQLATEF